MTVNSSSDLKKIINKGFHNGTILICGQERKLIDESIKIVYNSVQSFPELNIITLEGESISFDIVSNACETLPIMADHKVVHINNFSSLSRQQKDNEDDQKQKKPKTGSDIINYLIEFSERKPEGIILLITIDNEIDERAKFVTSVKSNGIFVQYNPLKGEELHKWVRDYFERYGKEIGKTEILYLISMAGSTTEQLDKEIEKLCAYSLDESVILKEHIDAVVHRNLESNIFKMVDSISKRDADGAILMLDTLLAQKEKHLSVLGMIIRQYRLMLLSHEYQKEKVPQESIGNKIKLKGYPLQNILKLSNNYDEKSLKNGLRKCLETDYKIKNGIYSGDELDLSLELLIAELCK